MSADTQPAPDTAPDTALDRALRHALLLVRHGWRLGAAVQEAVFINPTVDPVGSQSRVRRVPPAAGTATTTRSPVEGALVMETILGAFGLAFALGLGAGFGLASLPVRRRSPMTQPHIPPQTFAEPIDTQAVAGGLQQIRDGQIEPTRVIATTATQREVERLWAAEREAWKEWYLATRRVRQANAAAWGQRLPAAEPLWPDQRLAWLGRNLGFEPERFTDEVRRTRAEHASSPPYLTFSGVDIISAA